MVNGNVYASVATTRYPPISATAMTPAIRARFRPDHEFLEPPEDSWGGGGQACGVGPFGAQGCCGGGQNWPDSMARVHRHQLERRITAYPDLRPHREYALLAAQPGNQDRCLARLARRPHLSFCGHTATTPPLPQ